MVEFFHQKLSSGLNVIMELNTDCASCATGYFVKAGSRNETPNIYGISHFLEHMLFHGTKTMPSAESMMNFVKENGIYTNAYTNGENINFYLNIPDVNLDKGLEVLEQAIFYPLLPKDKIKNESNVVSIFSKDLESAFKNLMINFIR